MDKVYDVYCNGVWQCTWPNMWIATEYIQEEDIKVNLLGKPRYWSIQSRGPSQPVVVRREAMASRFS